MKEVELKIGGIHCKSCKMLIEDALDDISINANVDVDKEIVKFSFNENKISLKKIKETIIEEGYSIQ